MIPYRRFRGLGIAVMLLAFVFSVSSRYVVAQTALGSIQGVVVDAENLPVAGVTVYPVTGPADTGPSHGVQTNADGRFRIEQLVPGVYQLSAFKVEDGYADTAEAFYAQPEHPLHSVTVDSATERAGVSLQLGAKCGILDIDVSDAVSQRPITHAVLVLQQRNSSSAVLSRDETFPAKVLTPASDVLISIHAPGYNPWHFSDEGRDYVTVRPGEHRAVHAALQASSPAK